MYKSLTGLAAAAILTIVAAPAPPADAAPIRNAPGLTQDQSVVDTVQYRRRGYRRAWRPYYRGRAWRPYYRRYAWRPYYRPYVRRYAWGPYYRPYYRRYVWGPYYRPWRPYYRRAWAYPGYYGYAGYPYYRRPYFYGPRGFIRIGPVGFGFW
jgi:hypothetical protein